MSTRIQVNLTIEDGANIDRVAEALRAQGLAINEIMRGIGVISGEADEQAIERLRRTPHVEALEQSRRIKLPPPDSPVQ